MESAESNVWQAMFGAMNSLIVRLSHSIFRLFLQLYKAQECPPAKHKAAAKFSSCDNQMEELKDTTGNWSKSLWFFLSMDKYIIQMRSPCFSIFRTVKIETCSLHLPIQQPGKTTWQITCQTYPVVAAINTEWGLFKAVLLQPLHLILKQGISSDHRESIVDESDLNPPHRLLRAK